MQNQLSGRVNLFLLVRSHAQLKYYLNLRDSDGAANQGGALQGSKLSEPGKVTEIHPLRRSRSEAGADS